MFGYVSINRAALTEGEYLRFRSFYCGLCRVLRERYGFRGQVTLSYDMTFLVILLSALYELEETAGQTRCALHPRRKHDTVYNEAFEYAADMNVALSYHMCLDNWRDDGSLPHAAQARLLRKGYAQVESKYPGKCARIAGSLQALAKLEKEACPDIDAPARCSGDMIGTLFAWREDLWAPTLEAMGDAMGRFVYFMDAYEDLPGDLKKGRFNPLKALAEREDYELLCKDALTMLMADCTREFETLPILQDAAILRNILYSGVWGKYALLQQKK